MGSKGAFVCTDTICELVPSYKVKAVDTTGAGDIFNGALVLAISEGRHWIEATRFACKTSAIAVTRIGAQSSAPYRNEVDVFNPEKMGKQHEKECTIMHLVIFISIGCRGLYR